MKTMKIIRYVICLCIGVIAGAAGGIYHSSLSINAISIIRLRKLQESYGLIAWPRSTTLSNEQIAANAREALANQLISTAPLYIELTEDRDKANLALISKKVIESRAFDSINYSDLRANAYASAECIANLPRSDDDPLPCLKSNITHSSFASVPKR
jgi:hypothetical protein